MKRQYGNHLSKNNFSAIGIGKTKASNGNIRRSLGPFYVPHKLLCIISFIFQKRDLIVLFLMSLWTTLQVITIIIHNLESMPETNSSRQHSKIYFIAPLLLGNCMMLIVFSVYCSIKAINLAGN